MICAGACILATPVCIQAKPAKFTDSCLEARKRFSCIKNFQTNQILTGIAIGARAGGVVGIAGNAGKSNKSSILPELLAGALAGGTIGYLGSIAQGQRHKDELRAAIDQDFAPTLGCTLPQYVASITAQ
ncbi:hypothetical protein SAMN05518801_12337 [Novosphingobium sp. CF614]|uniref:hypothetical protein n=1 Tax=Novosphingobium sp. CF614 TaxID=1884364 RepID=UPI0008EC8138|nr:hypothetical protein [Novosphingobium sp. CF614]SFG41010.1 hypothetical protein SAMN05518801_12337 [Novosphingobium sp. CF614]